MMHGAWPRRVSLLALPVAEQDIEHWLGRPLRRDGRPVGHTAR